MVAIASAMNSYIAYRMSYIARKKQREKNVGLEADPILVRRYCLSIHEIFIINRFTRIENDLEERGLTIHKK